MPEINNKLSFKNKNPSVLLKQFEKDLMEYVNQGKDLVAKDKRKRQVFSTVNRFTAKLKAELNRCPEGFVWDQATRTCKPIL
jgi:hypothetical protein